MNNYFYSPQNNMFYPVELMDVYKAAGTWPEDAFSIDYAVYEAFVINEPPLGKKRATGVDGNPCWVDSLVINDIKKSKIQEIKNRRDEVTADYIIIDGKHFHSDTNSRIQQLSLTRMGQEKQVPAGLMWQTKNNGLIELTNDIAAQFESVTMDHDMRLFANAQRHIAAIEALEDIQAVIDYDYSSGWQP
ncbi:Phage tail fiber assembly [Salmonella enterica]|uniref:Phage tail fiber assembly n=2 Tax=Salmonella enterica TaxID=28901 RepID=A0A379QQG2_SALER|nr:Phage tail fiber assembly [Salmonella enterica]